VTTLRDNARYFREQIIELLMTNHPHDCAVCDEGGSCHLQDMTVMTGHNSRKYRFKKRTYKNQYLGPFLNHEMTMQAYMYRIIRHFLNRYDNNVLEVAKRLDIGKSSLYRYLKEMEDAGI
jgi:NADH-quinone oxidoreductase subunit G